MLTTSISDFRKDIKNYLDKVTQNFETLIINRGKDSGVVVISLEEYNSLQATQYELSSKSNETRLDSAIGKLRKGDGFIKETTELWDMFLWMNPGKTIYIGKRLTRKWFGESMIYWKIFPEIHSQETESQNRWSLSIKDSCPDESMKNTDLSTNFGKAKSWLQNAGSTTIEFVEWQLLKFRLRIAGFYNRTPHSETIFQE